MEIGQGEGSKWLWIDDEGLDRIAPLKITFGVIKFSKQDLIDEIELNVKF